MKYALEVNNVFKHYKGFSLHDVSFALPAGTIMGFVGENGAGKTTTIKLILDLIRRDDGDICVMGQQAEQQTRELKEHIGVVFDESIFPENATAKDMNRIMRSCYQTWEDNKYKQFLDRFSLPADKRVKEYSRGMRMKLAIAIALSHDSHLLILDEPTSGLDPIVREEILDVFMDFIQDEAHSIFMSSHITTDLEKICDYITFIHQGRIVLSEAKDELLEKYVLMKGTNEELQNLPADAVVGIRRGAFGAEALLMKDQIGSGFVYDPVSIETIMLYHVRGAKQ